MKKQNFLLYPILLLGVFSVFASSCEKEIMPVVTTTAVSNIIDTTATSGGDITDEGSSTVISRGVCWSTGTTPTISDNKTADGAGAGSYSSKITGLNGATVYYVRAYASNSEGTGYGMALAFTTLGQEPVATTQTAINITGTSAILKGTVNANYLNTIVTFEYGTTTSYGNTITATQSPLTGNANISVSANTEGLIPITKYHFRIKAENEMGTTFGDDMTFTTLGQVPTVVTSAAMNISTTGAILKGTVNANYLNTIVTFEYGTTTSYGNTIIGTQSPVTGNTNMSVSAEILELNFGTTYHFRVKAENELGTIYGDNMTFITLGLAPYISTIAVSNISSTSATLVGSVNPNYLSTEVTFEYGTTTSYGSTTIPSQSPITGNTVTNVSSDIMGLIVGTLYHFRIKAENALGTTYSNDLIFTTAPPPINDIDGNTYNVIRIGTQVWMAENLKSTKYNDGSNIPLETDNATWASLTTPAYCWYSNDKSIYGDTYGALYNWYTVETGNLCPAGWHVPTDEDWKTMEIHLGMSSTQADRGGYRGTDEGGKLKETGTTHWSSPNTGATNESGFTALPGGRRYSNGPFGSSIGSEGNWWSKSINHDFYVWYRYMEYNYSKVGRSSTTKEVGFSVRCVRD